MDGSNNGEMMGWKEQTSLPKPPPTLALQSQVYHYYRRSSSAKIQAKRSNIPAVHYPSPETQRYLVRALITSEEEKGAGKAPSAPVEQEVESEQNG